MGTFQTKCMPGTTIFDSRWLPEHHSQHISQMQKLLSFLYRSLGRQMGRNQKILVEMGWKIRFPAFFNSNSVKIEST